MKTPEEVLARFVALYGVRNTVLENFHTGQSPHSPTGDYSDVKVVTPEEEIPWTRLSRLSDPELRQLMRQVEKQIANCLSVIGKREKEGRREEFLAHLAAELFGEHGISWDLPAAKYAERQRRAQRWRQRAEEGNATTNR